jgi:hypothetical protein
MKEDRALEVLQQISDEWAENWDLLINFLGQEIADKIDEAVGYNKND